MKRRDFFVNALVGGAALIGLPSILSAENHRSMSLNSFPSGGIVGLPFPIHTDTTGKIIRNKSIDYDFYIGQIVEILQEMPIAVSKSNSWSHGKVSKGTLMTVSELLGNNQIRCAGVNVVVFNDNADNGSIESISLVLDNRYAKPYTEVAFLLPGQKVKLLKDIQTYNHFDFTDTGIIEKGTIAEIYTTRIHSRTDKTIYFGYGFHVNGKRWAVCNGIGTEIEVV